MEALHDNVSTLAPRITVHRYSIGPSKSILVLDQVDHESGYRENYYHCEFRCVVGVRLPGIARDSS